MTFSEFLVANGDKNLKLYLDSINDIETIPDAFYNPLYEKLKMYGIAGVKIEGLTIYPKGGDTLFSADYVKLKMNPFKLLFLTPDIRRLDVKNMSIRFVKSDSTSNFDFLYKETKKANADSLTAESSGSRLNYAKNTDYLLSLVLGILPAKANIDKLDISYINRGYSLNIHLTSLM